MTRNELVVLIVTSIGHGVCHLGELLFPAVLVAVMREFELPPDEATLLVLLGYVLMGVGALPVGLWADAGDPWRIHLWFFVSMALGCAAVALAGSPTSLFVALTILGLATSIYHPTGLAMLSLGTRNSNMSMGINGVAGSIGIALAPLLGQQAQLLGNWRWAYWVVCGVAVLAGLLMVLLWKWRFRIERYEELLRGSGNVGAGSGPPFPWLLMGVMLLGGINYRCLVTTLPPLLNDRLPAEYGGLAASLILLAGCGGQLLSGKFGDLYGSRALYLGLVLALVPLGLTLGVVSDARWTVLCAGLYSVCLFGQQPVENTLLAESTPIRRRSLSYGIKFILTFGIGALGTQIVGEYWRWTGSLEGVFFLLAATAWVMGGMLILSYTRRARLRPVVVEAVEA